MVNIYLEAMAVPFTQLLYLLFMKSVLLYVVEYIEVSV